ncbi:MAG: chromosomal replication initiator protein DnaA, partial [Patescibacteria group bacterium]
THPAKVWQAALGELEVALSKANFTTWFKNTQILHATETVVTIGVPNTFAQEWLSKKYHVQIIDALKPHYPDLEKVEYRIATGTQKPEFPDPESSAPVSFTPTANASAARRVDDEEERGSYLNASYTFDTFIVGNSNRLAHAAAMAAAERPGTPRYNPLYIYGGVGLGKTHLMQAVGNTIKKQNPSKRIVYASCEAFTTEFIEALQNKRRDEFKKRYRNADVLLIDDIQFLSSKEATQEEFFHTFNTLHQTNRQIIMTSDTRPQSISQLAPRLSSRFGWGMVADIQSPDIETRQAILRYKCEEKGFVLDPEITEYLAREVASNIRELEGTLNSLITHCELYRTTPSLALARELVEQSGASTRTAHLSPDTIFRTVAEFFSLDLGELLGKRRHKELVYPRQIAMYLMRVEMSASFPKIGKALGGKDHTTVMHGVEKITKELQKNESLQRDLVLLKERLYSQ